MPNVTLGQVVKDLVTFTIAFTGAIMLSRDRMDRQAWALVAGLVLASTAFDLLVPSFWLTVVFAALVLAGWFVWRLMYHGKEGLERPSAR